MLRYFNQISSVDMEDDPYEILGVSVNASTREIHRKFLKFSKQFHPDISDDSEGIEKLKRINFAKSFLLDPVGRARHDLTQHKDKLSQEDIRHRMGVVWRKTREDVEYMRFTVRRNLDEEEHFNGLVIIKALFGDVRSRERAYFKVGSVLDVTVPLQCQVHESSLVLPSIDTAWLRGTKNCFYEGVYDPLEGEGTARQLYIRYRYFGTVYEHVFSKDEDVAIPNFEHSTVKKNINGLGERKRLKQRLSSASMWSWLTFVSFSGGFLVALSMAGKPHLRAQFLCL